MNDFFSLQLKIKKCKMFKTEIESGSYLNINKNGDTIFHNDNNSQYLQLAIKKGLM